MLQSGVTANKNNTNHLADDWSCVKRLNDGLPMCVHHVENNLKPKGYGAGKKVSILVFDGHASRWLCAGLLYLMTNNCWSFCLMSHKLTSSWVQT